MLGLSVPRLAEPRYLWGVIFTRSQGLPLYDWQQALHVRLLLADVPVAIPGVDYATTLDGIALCRLEDLDARLRDLDAAATAARDHGDE